MASDRFARGFLFVVVASLFGSSPAFAQSSADKETARTLMKQGDDKFVFHDYAGAMKAYQAAHAIMRAPTTGLALAKAQMEQGLLVEARDTLLEVMRQTKEPSDPVAYGRARDEASTLAAKILDRIPSVVITVEGPPSGTSAEITIDGAAIPAETLGSPRKVNPGQHVIAASAPGFQQGTQRVNLREAEHAKVALDLKPGSSVIPGGKSRIHVESEGKPGNVFVDGKAVGATPLDVPVSSGSHKVEVEYPGGSRDDRSVDVAAGASADVKFSPSAMDDVGRSRKGVHWGLSVAPSMSIDTGVSYGGLASLLLNIGITPMFDFRTGVTAGGLYRGEANNTSLHVLAVVPAMLGVNYSPWFSAWGGLSGGFILIKDEKVRAQTGGVIGPEWSLLTLRAGEKRQYEMSFAQGVRFGNLPTEYHQSVMFTYLFLD